MRSFAAFAALSTSATPPHALGLAMLVPFMSWRPAWVHCGTGAIAPPGALSVTPVAPSGVGPRLLQVYCWPCVWQGGLIGPLSSAKCLAGPKNYDLTLQHALPLSVLRCLAERALKRLASSEQQSH